MIQILKLILATLIFASSNTYQLQLSWDQSIDPVAGYDILVGTASRSYTNTIDVSLTTTTLITNLNPGILYFFTADAYDTNKLKSDYSNEIFFIKPQTDSQEIIFDLIAPAAGSYIIQTTQDLNRPNWKNVTAPIQTINSANLWKVHVLLYIDNTLPMSFYRAKLQ